MFIQHGKTLTVWTQELFKSSFHFLLIFLTENELAHSYLHLHFVVRCVFLNSVWRLPKIISARPRSSAMWPLQNIFSRVILSYMLKCLYPFQAITPYSYIIVEPTYDPPSDSDLKGSWTYCWANISCISLSEITYINYQIKRQNECTTQHKYLKNRKTVEN